MCFLALLLLLLAAQKLPCEESAACEEKLPEVDDCEEKLSETSSCALSVLQRRTRGSWTESWCRDGLVARAFNLPVPRPQGSAGLQCEARIARTSAKKQDYWKFMDAPLVLPNRSVGGPGSWKVITSDLNVSTKFGTGHWMWPPGTLKEGVRILYLHGCGSECDVDKPYYSTLTTRLAKWANAPLLGKNFLQYPEYPWPENVRAVLADLQDCLTAHLPGSSPTTRCYLAGDSVAALTVLQSVMALKDPQLRGLLAISPDLTLANVSGIGLFSPVLDIACKTPSLYNTTFAGSRGKASLQDYNLTHEQSFLWCAYSYLVYFGGMRVQQSLGRMAHDLNYTAVRNELGHWPIEFWSNPQINPLTANLTGVPPLFVVSSTGDYYEDDARALAQLACQSSGDVETYVAEGLWHCFLEYSDGACRENGSEPLLEGLEAYGRWQSFVERTAAKYKKS